MVESMTSRRRALWATGLAAASVLVLAGCSEAESDEPEDTRPSVVASTDVYGQIVQAIAGDIVAVTAIIDSPAMDPHAYEASAQDQLSVSKADLIVENGGGYDAFIDGLIESSATTADVLTAVEFSPEWPGESAHDDSEGDGHGHEHIEGFNEHVWYDLEAMTALAAGIEQALSALSPGDEATFAANLAEFQAHLGGLQGDVAAIDAEFAGDDVFVTEPVPLYLVDDAGLDDVTPDAFREAVEDGYDIPPATLLEALDLLESGTLDALIANPQAGGPQVTQVVEEAQTLGIPVVEFTETLPEGQTYLSWMQANISALHSALGS